MEADLQGQNLFFWLCPYPERSLKALQLLEYLVKNGSERVVDDARSHVGTIKMLRNFYYVDEKGKDQGINGESLCRCRRHVYSTLASPQPFEGASGFTGRRGQNPL